MKTMIMLLLVIISLSECKRHKKHKKQVVLSDCGDIMSSPVIHRTYSIPMTHYVSPPPVLVRRLSPVIHTIIQQPIIHHIDYPPVVSGIDNVDTFVSVGPQPGNPATWVNQLAYRFRKKHNKQSIIQINKNIK